MNFDYGDIEEIVVNFGKKIIHGIKITRDVLFNLYNLIYNFFILSKTYYKKTKENTSYSVKDNSVVLPGDDVSIDNYEGELKTK